MGNLLEHAEAELDRAGIGDPDADYDGGLKPAVLDIVRTFAGQDHSGGSAAMTIALVEKLLRFEPIEPLTGSDDEWDDVSWFTKPGAGLWQNRRCSRVFKREDGTAYDVEGRVVHQADGWASAEHVEVTFPYVPTTEHVDAEES